MDRYNPVNLAKEQSDSIQSEISDAIRNINFHYLSAHKDDSLEQDIKLVGDHYELVYRKIYKISDLYIERLDETISILNDLKQGKCSPQNATKRVSDMHIKFKDGLFNCCEQKKGLHIALDNYLVSGDRCKNSEAICEEFMRDCSTSSVWEIFSNS